MRMSHTHERSRRISRAPPPVTDPPRARHIRVNAATHAGAPVKCSDLFHGERLEDGAPFCGNPACALHVRLRDEAVEGGGNWLTLPDGRMFGRSRFGNTLLCDACGTRRGPVRLDDTFPRRQLTS